MNLNYRIGRTAKNGNDGPLGKCGKRDNDCRDYNYGSNAAEAAFLYANSQGASSEVWWIDIETANSWSRKSAQNVLVIQGAVDYLVGQGRTVGIYSTSFQWGQITGGYDGFGVPIWIAGATDAATAAAFCENSSLFFAGGDPWLVQYVENGLDRDYAC